MPAKLREPFSERNAPSLWLRPALYLLLFLLCYLAYRGILDNGLFNDDYSWLRAAKYGMTPGNILSFQVVEFFRPLINLSFYAMERLWPGNVAAHYALNLILHFLCSVLVYHLVTNLTRNAAVAAATAALFAVTSVHTAAVLWISARTTLVSTFFLLAAITVLTSSEGRPPVRIGAATMLYLFALASKEEAIAGVLLVALIFFLTRPSGESRPVGRTALVCFAGVSIVYLVLRQSFMGGFFKANWGLGPHVLRNLGGGFLYQLYPWPLLSLIYPRAAAIPRPSSPFVPELLAAPLVVILLWIGYAAKKSRAMNVAVGWSLVALLPVAPFRYRFLSTESISQDRYYYLSSVGSMLTVALLLSMLWNVRSRLSRGATILIFIVLCAGHMVRVDRLERKWDTYTRMCRDVVAMIIEESSRFQGVTTLAIENSPMLFQYVADGIALERPAWKVVEVHGGKAEAARYAPCLYVSFSSGEKKLMRIVKIRRDE
jgi:hypothetical protein